jgi:hypothetical protein
MRVTVSRTPRARATIPTTCAVSTGLPRAKAEASATGRAAPLLDWGWTPGDGLGVDDGAIAGNRPDALLAPMSCPVSVLMVGTGPMGRARSAGVMPADV